MNATPSSEEIAHLRSLVPLHTLPEEALEELLSTAQVESLRKGEILFREGDTDHENIYLLEGRVSLLSGSKVVESIDAGTETSRFPIAHQLPRTQTARAHNRVRIIRIDSRRLSDMLARSRTVDYQVADLEEASEDDWMTLLLQSRVLQQVPAANIQRVIMSVEQVEVGKGEDLIRQGDPGDYYYMLTSGRAVVKCDNNDGKGVVELATLGPGDAFGEEALLSDKPRNSTISMLQDGEVLRLGKEHFLDLIQSPLLDRVDLAAGQAKVDQGALWLDLRSSDQYDQSHLPGAINFPFESLRYQAASLAPDRHYVLYSNTGGRAMAGAFLLTERGFDVSVLQGGLHDQAISEASEAPPADVATTAEDAVGSAAEDEIIQQRIREAEQRARELEERLKVAQRDQQAVEAERQQQLQKVQLAVEQARRKLLETEQQKLEALEERQRAYAEMERLTGNLEQLENERTSLVDRMAEIEGLDKQMQSRLAKAERELIGERERAESASSSLEELSEKLSEVIGQREQEREQHARERGELKEEMTALQMELEQAQLDLDEARAAQQAEDALAAQREATVAEKQELQRSLDAVREESEHRLEGLQAELDRLRADNEALRADLASGSAEAGSAIEQAEARAGDLEERLANAEKQAMEEQQAAAARLGELEAELATLREERDSERQASADADSRRSELQQALDELKSDNAALQNRLAEDLERGSAESAEREQRLQQERDAARRQVETLQAELDEQAGNSGETERVQAAEIARLQSLLDERGTEEAGRVAELQSELADLQQHYREMQSAEAGRESEGDEKLAQLRDELSELRQQLEERDLALSAARSEQAELIEALNTAGAERETLQLALSEKDDEQARLVDLENQVAEAIRSHERELLAHEQAQRELREQLDAEMARREAAEHTAATLGDGATAGSEEPSSLREERDALLAELAVRDSEVEQLRGVIEEYVDQIRAAQDVDDASEIGALRSELEMVREQAIRDVAKMREQLAAAETQKRRLQEADGREAISMESMRQRIEELEASLAERQRDIAAAEEARHMLEDSLEDANAQLDQVTRQLENAREEANESLVSRREAESARDQLAQALREFTEGDASHVPLDLRDDRLAGSSRPITLDGGSAAGRWLAAAIGAGLVFAGLEAVSLFTGNGELVSALLRAAGR